jgi:plasmid stabilization system protein ParE
MKIQLSDHAQLDLRVGYLFYEAQAPGVGGYFIDSLISDIDSLLISAGTHQQVHGYHRALSKRFPFAIYYLVEKNNVRIRRILDCRKNPAWVTKQVKKG